VPEINLSKIRIKKEQMEIGKFVYSVDIEYDGLFYKNYIKLQYFFTSARSKLLFFVKIILC